MKLSFKNILSILLIFTLLILLAGCGTTLSLTYTVTYDGNTNTGGVVPTDANLYEEGVSVTVLGQGSLVKTCTPLTIGTQLQMAVEQVMTHWIPLIWARPM